MPERGFAGILLAAGKGTRFDPSGARSKLAHVLDDGTCVAVAAARNLLAVLPDVLAVVRPEGEQLARQLEEAGCMVTVCADADEGMAASLVHALQQRGAAQGWVIALGDMPHVRPSTITALLQAVNEGAQIAAPAWRGQRGNPVAFSRAYLPDLLALRGDEGARRLLKIFPVAEVAVDDPGIRYDIDTVEDLGKGGYRGDGR